MSSEIKSKGSDYDNAMSFASGESLKILSAYTNEEEGKRLIQISKISRMKGLLGQNPDPKSLSEHSRSLILRIKQLIFENIKM